MLHCVFRPARVLLLLTSLSAALACTTRGPVTPDAPVTGVSGVSGVSGVPADTIVAAARRALGWDRFAGSGTVIRLAGDARMLETDARQTLLFDGRGRFVETIEGPLAQASGSDGHTTWTRDWSGTPCVLVLGDATEAQLGMLFATGRWAAQGAPLSFERVHGAEVGPIDLRFVHADGIARGTIRLDPATHLPVEVTYGSDSTPTTWTLRDFQREAGLLVPTSVDSTQGGRSRSFIARSIESVPEADDALFEPRLAPAGDVRFDPSVAPGLEVKRVPSGHLLVRPTIDGAELGWFIFDTGAGINCIANDVAGLLPVGPFGEIGARGIGGTVAAHFFRAKELALGPLRVTDPLFMGLDLAFLEEPFGVKVAGILGYELLARCVAEVDVGAAEIALFDPAFYELSAGGRWEEALIYARHPCVRATFEGHERVFRVDTGAAGDTVTLHYQTVADLDLLQGRATSEGKTGGVGGTVGTRDGELASFTLGGHEFGTIRAAFMLEDKGALSDDYVAGNIGGQLLKPFRLVFDYPHRRLGFIPR